MNVLVVGGEGYVSQGIYKRLTQIVNECKVTTRRRGYTSPSRPFFSLEDFGQLDYLQGIDFVILTAFESSYLECATSQSAHYKNTVCVPNAVTFFLKQGKRVIFISSNAVFDSESYYPLESDSPNPSSPYGLHKLSAETASLLGAQGLGCLTRLTIVRSTKILDAQSKPISFWVKTWQRGCESFAYDDSWIAPVSIRYLSESLFHLMSSELSGIFHLSGSTPITYANMASTLSKSFPHHKREIDISASRQYPGYVSFKYGALGMAHTVETVGIMPLSIPDLTCDLLNF